MSRFLQERHGPPGRGLRTEEVVVGGGWRWVEGQWEQPGCKDLSISASLFPITHLRLWLRPRIPPRPSPIVSSIIRTRSSAHPPTHQARPPARLSSRPRPPAEVLGAPVSPSPSSPCLTLDSERKERRNTGGETKRDQSHACDPCPILRPG